MRFAHTLVHSEQCNEEQQSFSFISFVLSNIVYYSIFNIVNQTIRSLWMYRFQPRYWQIKYLNVILLLVHPQISLQQTSSVHCSSTKKHFRIESNPSKRATAACWKTFGFPAMSTDDHPSTYNILPGFASCKICFETYKYIDSSTANLNSHRCCRDSSDQSSLVPFLQSPRSSNMSRIVSKRKEEIKETCAK